MKRKGLSAILAVCLLGAFSGMLNCACSVADCGAVPRGIQTKVIPCHPEDAQTKRKDPSHADCCGTCQIEKAAVLSNKGSLAADVRPWDLISVSKLFTDRSSRIQAPSFYQGERSGSPHSFFEQHVFGTTFSFRAPPYASVL